MATTLTDKGEMLFASFDIEKMETNEDGDLVVYGKATDATLDHDQQIIDPVFSAKAMADWHASGANVRVQHNPQRDPAGIGIETYTDDKGATWVKSLIVEPIAKKLVAKGVLRAYSVGIANPTIERDMTGKARGGIIKGGKIVELSLVDRPANPSCGVSLMKAVDGGLEFSGELFGDDSAIAKALNATMVKQTSYDESLNNKTIDEFDTPADISFDFNPNDLMRIMQEKMVMKAIDDAEMKILGKGHRSFSPDRRRALAGSHDALPDGSYPIPDKDALRRAAILARSGHGNVSAARALISRRAQELGVSNPLNSNDSEKTVDVEVVDVPVEVGKADHDAMPESLNESVDENDDGANPIPKPGKAPSSKAAGADVDPDDEDDSDDDCSAKTDTPDVVKDPAPAKKPKKGKGGKPMPPWLNKPASGDDSSCKMDHDHTEKCHTPPDQAAGVSGHDMEAAPVGDLKTSPAPEHMKSAVTLRYKTLGIDAELGMLHDLMCPAYHPAEVGKFFPGVDVTTSIDPELWQRKALAAATAPGRSIAEALEAQSALQHANTLKAADPAVIYDYRLELNKAFRDANPGPTSGLSPGHIAPKTFHRGNITAGHASYGTGYGSPNNSAQVATGTPNAHHFDNPPLSSGHQSPSPSHMKGEFEYPTEQGVPTNITYAEIEKEKARRSLSMMHDHLIHMFPSVCPILDQDAYRQEQPTPVPPTSGLGKTVEPEAEALGGVFKYIRKLEKKVIAGEITEAQARKLLSERTAKKYAESLKKQVDQGMTSRDEVLKALGVEMPKPEVEKTVEPVVQKAVTADTSGLTPDIMKSMMTEILAPFQQRIEAQDKHIEDQTTLLNSYQEKLEAQSKEIETHNARWDALANKADPSSASFANLALNPLQRPARPVEVQKSAQDRVNAQMMRQLERAWRTSENPAEREAAYAALMKIKANE